jgi:hypothetical protein
VDRDPRRNATDSRSQSKHRQFAWRASAAALGLLLVIAVLRYVIPAKWWPSQGHSWTDVILVIVTAAYATVTFFQLRALRETLTQSAKAQRAWLFPERWRTPIQLPKSGPR